MSTEPNGERRRVLIVDDELQITHLMKLLLERKGPYEVRTENDSRRAAAAAAEFLPEIIFLDVVMPHIDGGGVAFAVRQNPLLRDVPLVFISAVVSGAPKFTNGSFAGQRFLTKPVTIERVIACIEELLPARPTRENRSQSAGASPDTSRKGRRGLGFSAAGVPGSLNLYH